MDPHHLKTKELSYELLIRKLDASGTVDAKRKRLRGVFVQEKANRSFAQITENPFSYSEDITEISETILDVRTQIDNFSGCSGDYAYKQMVSRLIHLGGRIERLTTTTEVEQTKRVEIQNELLELEGDLDFKILSSATPASCSTPVRSISTSNTTQNKYVAPYKWNVKFAGTNKESVVAFLERINVLREARGVSKRDLFLAAGDLFEGVAYIWLTQNKKNFNTWDDLVQQLKLDFLPYNYEDELKREIDRRTQGPNEKIIAFISCMENLFSRLNEIPSELSRVNIIKKNLHPYYISRLALSEPKTISELTKTCRLLEESRAWSERYIPPSRNQTNLLEPDLACSSSNNSFSKSKFTLQNSRPNISATNTIKCFNCHIPGHTYQHCRKPKNLFCYGCGLPNVTKLNCSRCNPKNSNSKNEARGGEKLDAVTSSQSPDTVNSTSVGTTSKKGKGPRK